MKQVFLIIFMVLFLSIKGLVLAQEPLPAAVTKLDSQPQQAFDQKDAPRQDVAQVEQASQETEAAANTLAPVIQIKPLQGSGKLYAFELRDVEIGDLFRALAQDYKLNLLVEEGIQGKVTASLSNVSLEEALETIAESQNLILEKKGNIIKVIPNLITKTFILKYVEAKKLLESSAASTPQIQGAASSKPNSIGTIYDFLSKKGKIFLNNQPNSITVVDYPANINKIEEFLKVTDQRMAIRIFKLKYLKAIDALGGTQTTVTTTQTSTAGGTTTQTTSTSAVPK
jgi:type II secretory pathway component HofQ